jgi:hypothetical protein
MQLSGTQQDASGMSGSVSSRKMRRFKDRN